MKVCGISRKPQSIDKNIFSYIIECRNFTEAVGASVFGGYSGKECDDGLCCLDDGFRGFGSGQLQGDDCFHRIGGNPDYWWSLGFRRSIDGDRRLHSDHGPEPAGLVHDGQGLEVRQRTQVFAVRISGSLPIGPMGRTVCRLQSERRQGVWSGRRDRRPHLARLVHRSRTDGLAERRGEEYRGYLRWVLLNGHSFDRSTSAKFVSSELSR